MSAPPDNNFDIKQTNAMTQHNPQPTPSNNATPRRRWPFFVMPGVIAGLLGGHIVFIILAITLATGDRSFAVVPDYYQKAVDWDQRQADLTASDDLGWQVDLTPSEQVDDPGKRRVVVSARDGAGQPIAGATARLHYYHLARAGEHRSAELAEVLPGQYTAELPMSAQGRWSLEIELQRGTERYVESIQRFVVDRKEAAQ
jgi:nitrogen fixation protein FixH